MNKQSLTILAIAFIVLPSVTKAQAFEPDSKVINVGIGVGGNYGVWSGGSSIPQINISYEQGVWETGGPGVITLGGFVGHKTYKYKAADWKWSWTTIGLRSAYHYNGINNEKVDLYGGLMLGYFIYSADGYTGGSGGMGLDGFLGARYFFAPNVGAFLELGGGMYNFSIFKVGASFKF